MTNISNLINIAILLSIMMSCLEKFRTLFSTVSIITTYSTVEFLILFTLLVLSLVGNSFRNLIYKVLNLAVMSIFATTLWAYVTDFNFIYVVYILAFVGAVVMLLLSVILMLPSSVVTTSSVRFIFLPILQIVDNNIILSFITGFVLFWFLRYLAIIFTAYFYYDYSWTDIRSLKTIVTLEPQWDESKAKKYMEEGSGIKKYIDTQEFLYGGNSFRRPELWEWECDIKLIKFDNLHINTDRLTFDTEIPKMLNKRVRKHIFDQKISDKLSKLIVLFAVPKVARTNNYFNTIAFIIYEFSEFYSLVIKPFFTGRYTQGFQNFFILRGRRVGFTFEDTLKHTFVVIQYTPRWSPFHLVELMHRYRYRRWYYRFVPFFNNFYHRIYYVAKVIRTAASWNLPFSIFAVIGFFLTVDKRLFTKYLIIGGDYLDKVIFDYDNVRKRFGLGKYIKTEDDDMPRSRGHRFDYMDNVLADTFFSIVRNIVLWILPRVNYIAKLIEVITQALQTLSTFLLAVPFTKITNDVNSSIINFTIENTGTENLAAVQQVLYYREPLLIFVCAITLLVALLATAALKENK